MKIKFLSYDHIQGMYFGIWISIIIVFSILYSKGLYVNLNWKFWIMMSAPILGILFFQITKNRQSKWKEI
ncbi:hypothetical protein LCGC14_2220960 [marine sediment metagenome]|uniref:Uncharacterized protein n=1 Tax=marine sediment metagenome TaxID=412755 RepID=A0A0F9G6J8_9ZZZZ